MPTALRSGRSAPLRGGRRTSATATAGATRAARDASSASGAPPGRRGESAPSLRRCAHVAGLTRREVRDATGSELRSCCVRAWRRAAARNRSPATRAVAATPAPLGREVATRPRARRALLVRVAVEHAHALIGTGALRARHQADEPSRAQRRATSPPGARRSTDVWPAAARHRYDDPATSASCSCAYLRPPTPEYGQDRPTPSHCGCWPPPAPRSAPMRPRVSDGRLPTQYRRLDKQQVFEPASVSAGTLVATERRPLARRPPSGTVASCARAEPASKRDASS